jgi:F-type H+-transporting ATPase subunit b
MFMIAHFSRPALIAAVAVALVVVPLQVPAQTPTPAASQSQSATSAQQGGSGAEAAKSDDNLEKQFLYAPAVKSIARMLHLSTDTTIIIFLGLNFAVIFLAIVIPLGRFMPKVIRRRSQTLSHDLKTARDATAEARARMSAVEAKLAGLGKEIENFRAQVEQEAQEDEKRIKAALAEESARIVASAEQEIGVAAAQARRGLRTFAADLAIEHASRQMALTPEADHALIKEFIAGAAVDASGKPAAADKGGQS